LTAGFGGISRHPVFKKVANVTAGSGLSGRAHTIGD
jgi:hypothetical protein